MHDEGKTREELLREVAMLRAIVAEFERVEAQRQRAEEVREVLYEISVAAHTAATLRELYAAIHRSLERIIDTRNFFIALHHAEGRLFSFPYAADEIDSYDDRPHDVSRGLTAWCAAQARGVLLGKAEIQELVEAGAIDLIGVPCNSWLGVPLIAGDETIGVMVVQSYLDDIVYTEEDLQILTFVSDQVATTIARKRTEEQLAEAYNRMKHDLSLAAKVQRSLLPREAPAAGDYDFAWSFDACDEVAGDMLNVFRLDEHRVGLYVLDVAGHGMQAALLSVTLNSVLTPWDTGAGILKGEDGAILPPDEVARLLNTRFPMSLETSQFFTLIYGILDIRTGEFRYVRAGQPPPIHIARESIRQLEGEASPSIGILADAQFEVHSAILAPGEMLLLHSDGVDEAMNLEGEEFGTTRVLGALRKSRAANVDTVISGLLSEVKHFARGAAQSDDITILGVGRKPAAR